MYCSRLLLRYFLRYIFLQLKLFWREICRDDTKSLKKNLNYSLFSLYVTWIIFPSLCFRGLDIYEFQSRTLITCVALKSFKNLAEILNWHLLYGNIRKRFVSTCTSCFVFMLLRVQDISDSCYIQYSQDFFFFFGLYFFDLMKLNFKQKTNAESS